MKITFPDPVSFDDYESPEFYTLDDPARIVAERIASGRCEGGCSFWACARKAGHPGPCQPDYEEQDRKAALTSAIVCLAFFVAGGIR